MKTIANMILNMLERIGSVVFPVYEKTRLYSLADPEKFVYLRPTNRELFNRISGATLVCGILIILMALQYQLSHVVVTSAVTVIVFPSLLTRFMSELALRFDRSVAENLLNDDSPAENSLYNTGPFHFINDIYFRLGFHNVFEAGRYQLSPRLQEAQTGVAFLLMYTNGFCFWLTTIMLVLAFVFLSWVAVVVALVVLSLPPVFSILFLEYARWQELRQNQTCP